MMISKRFKSYNFFKEIDFVLIFQKSLCYLQHNYLANIYFFVVKLKLNLKSQNLIDAWFIAINFDFEKKMKI